MNTPETIRFLYAERCSPPEIPAAIGWPVEDVIDWMERPSLHKVRAWRTGEMKVGQTAYEVSVATGRSKSAVRSAAARQGVELARFGYGN